MHYLNIWLSVNDPAHTAQVAELLTEAGRLSRAEPGCLRFEVYHSTSDPARFLLCERWESDVALAAHRQGKAYTQIYQPRVLPLVTREPHPSQLLE